MLAELADLADLTETVDGLEIPLDRDALVAAIALHQRLGARIALAVARFEGAGLHEDDGALTVRSWLQQHAGTDPRAAAHLVSAGRKLRALPALAGAALRGELTGGQVDVVLHNVPGRHVQRFAEHEQDLVPHLAALDLQQTVQVMNEWRARADAVDDAALPPEHENEVHLARTIDGRGELRASLDADRTAVVEAALRVADPKDFDLTLAERRAEALDVVCRFFLDHQRVRRGGRHRPHVNVVMREDGSGTYVDTGQPVSAPELGSILCDCTLHRVLVSGPAILDYGRSTRTPPVDLHNAVVTRDQGCRWPGCDRPPSWCDAHHVVEVERGGGTELGNLVLLCRRHHRKLHARRPWHAKLLPDGTFVVTAPDGRSQTSDPPLGTRSRRRPRAA